jgi:hypothetical protein
VLNSALARDFFNLTKPEFALLLASFGCVVSFLWYRVNFGSRFRQSLGEERLADIGRNVAPNLRMFYATIQRSGRQKQPYEEPTGANQIPALARCASRQEALGQLQQDAPLHLRRWLEPGWSLLIVLKLWQGVA